MIETQRFHARTLIETLHPEPSVNAMIEVVGLAKRATPANRYYQDIAVATEAVLELNAIGYNVFIGCNPRNVCSGFESSVPYVSDLFLDLQPERTSIEAVEQFLTKIGMPPTVVADSGHGAHMHFRVHPADPIRAKLIWERLCKFTGSDRVFNVNRICRVPGSVNWKTVPKWCAMKSVNREYIYDVEYINKCLDTVGAPPARTPKEGIPVPINPPEDWLALRKLIAEQPGGEGVLDIIDTGERNPYSEKQVTRSEADWVVICSLVRAGCPDEMVIWVYETQPVGQLKYREEGPRYLYRTIESARRATADRPERSGSKLARDAHRLSGNAPRRKH